MTVIEDRTEALLEWIKNTEDETFKPSTHSFISPKIEIKQFEQSGRGIAAKDDIKRSQQILRIPHSFLLNFTTVVSHITRHNSNIKLKEPYYLGIYVPLESTNNNDKFTNIYKSFELQDLLALTSFQLLSLYLCFERQRIHSSFWKPFLEMLPDISDFSLNPLIWQVLQVDQWEELIQFLPESAKRRAEDVYERFLEDYVVVRALVSRILDDLKLSESSADEYIPVDLFLWAWMCINSRCLYMTIPQGKTNADNFTMAPYVDFLNHSCNDECSILIDTTGFHVRTTTPYMPGDQLFLSYGPHCNEFLLCEYGFVIPHDNKWNDLDISAYIIPLLKPQHVEFLKENDYFDKYTMTNEGISFRTEVVLATVQENSPSVSRRLQALLNGIGDGATFKSHSHVLLKEIIKKVLHECDQYKHLEYNDDKDINTRERKKTIGILYKNRSEIANNILSTLE
ncbi:hypothetical protein G9P44_000379 [Scheffersomyces stipitis]|nr:hypothetical protein G9P44_000379 [Scheffersomyces stipitis]